MGEGEEGEKEKEEEEGVGEDEDWSSAAEATENKKGGVTGVPLAILPFLDVSKRFGVSGEVIVDEEAEGEEGGLKHCNCSCTAFSSRVDMYAWNL